MLFLQQMRTVQVSAENFETCVSEFKVHTETWKKTMTSEVIFMYF